MPPRPPLGIFSRVTTQRSFFRNHGSRHLSGARTTTRPLSGRTRLALLAGGTTITVFGVANSRLHADAVAASAHEAADEVRAQYTRPPTPLRELVRTYVVYSICSFPTLVDWSPKILSTLLSIPVISSITEAVVRVTFFDQFVGADTALETVPLLSRLRTENKGCLFAYSVEVDEDEAKHNSGVKGAGASSEVAPHKRAVQEMLTAIEVAADFEDGLGTRDILNRKTWVAIKLTALLPDAGALVRMSSDLVKAQAAEAERIAFPGIPLPARLDALQRGTVPQGSALTPEDVHALIELRDDVFAICERAEQRGVKIIMDAEYSWYTPAIDAYVHALMLRFNKLDSTPARPPRSLLAYMRALAVRSAPGDLDSKRNESGVQPLVYQTYQAYLQRTPEYLEHSLAHARRHGYALGVKLVRGAYHPHELSAHAARNGTGTHSLSISPDAAPPVWAEKRETDTAYDGCVAALIAAVAADAVGAPSGRAPGIGVLFGTHNAASAELILEHIRRAGLARVDETGKTPVFVLDPAVTARVAMGQLYGMYDELTNKLVDSTRSDSPFVLKYVPYGGLKEVMPYLSRRAIENKSVLFEGAAANERREAGKQIRARLFG